VRDDLTHHPDVPLTYPQYLTGRFRRRIAVNSVASAGYEPLSCPVRYGSRLVETAAFVKPSGRQVLRDLSITPVVDTAPWWGGRGHVIAGHLAVNDPRRVSETW